MPLTPPSDEQIVEMLQEDYKRLLHAMQSGVAAEMTTSSAHEPKHLRVGVNSALLEAGALARLLTSKGIITEVEYWTALRNEVKLVVDEYEKRLSDHYHTNITLG